MSDLTDAAAPDPGVPYEPPTAGAALRAAREAAGLTIDAVAQQLKLAPRQVKALEDEDFAQLPGRTFVRGFVRNYARFVGLPPDEVVALLPGVEIAPSLSRPTITPSSRAMGELPAEAPARRAWTRWAIPLALVAIVGAAGVYEFRRPQSESRRTPVEKSAPAAAAPAPVTSSGGTTTASLPNPLAGSDTTASTPAPTAGGTPGGPAATDAVTAAPPASAEPPATTAAAPPPASADALLVLTFTATSWVQVKDRNGNVVLAETGQPGSTQAVSGALPLDIVIGNAPAVHVTFRGQPVDIAPHVRANVARLSLK